MNKPDHSEEFVDHRATPFKLPNDIWFPNPHLPKRRIPKTTDENLSRKFSELSAVTSFEQLLKVTFPDRTDISLLDIGSGNGAFPLEIAKMRQTIGIERIVASDVNLSYMSPNQKLLHESNIEVHELDVRDAEAVSQNKFDIITINAPYALGPHSFAVVAIDASLQMVKTPGLVILRMNEVDGVSFDPFQIFPFHQSLFKFRELIGLPNTSFTTYTEGNRTGKSTQVYVAYRHL